jgi:hypothetical protein
MTETHQARDLLVTLRDALHQLEGTLERTRDGIDAIASQADRLRAGVEALNELRQREEKVFQRCWSARLFGCTRVRAPFNPIE